MTPAAHPDFIDEPAPWEAEAGPELLDDVRKFLRRFLALPSEHAYTAVALWIAHTHALDAFDSTPRLAMLSPEPGSGKTRVLEVLEVLVPKPMHVLNASPAAIFRTIEKARPTLLLDEVDALWGNRGKDDGAEDMRALLNAGHRAGATIPRCVGPQHAVTMFPVYCATALAGLGDLPDTLMTRSVIIRMRRRAPGEKVEPFRHRVVEPQGHRLRDRLAAWTDGVYPQLDGAWPEMPDGVTDRPADTWEALLAIADAAGGHWPDTARTACVELCKVVASREASLGVRLLTDLRIVFGDDDRLATETLLDRLHKLEEAPWSDLRGKPLDARGLARRLGAYDVTSTKVKIGDASLRGYRREDLWDAWNRYLPDGSTEPPEPAEPSTSEAMAEVPDDRQVPEPSGEAEPHPTLLTSIVPEVPQVPHPAEPEDHDYHGPCVECGNRTGHDDRICSRCRVSVTA